MDVSLELIEKFDLHLLSKQKKYRASIIGGAVIMLVANSKRTTGDIDSLTKIPEDIKLEIEAFAAQEGIPQNWINDNASRNLHEFLTKAKKDSIFAREIFSGMALFLFAPSNETILLSKIYPMLDRQGMDLIDIKSLLESGFVTKDDFIAALDIFKERIRFEEESHVRKKSWAVYDLLTKIAAKY